MAKGAKAKEEVFAKILETFEGSFMYNSGKECRINWNEDGNIIQLKVTLTAAKEPVSIDGDVAVAKEAEVKESAAGAFPAPKNNVEPTPEEKKNAEDLLKSLGLA